MNKPKPIQHGLLFLMKVTMFSILISSFSLAMATAHSSAGQETLERKVTIDVKNSEFQDVLLHLAKQARVKFVYSPQIVKKEKKVTLALNEVSLADALSELLGGNYRYRVIGKQIVLVPHAPDRPVDDAARKFAFAFKVSGVVTDGAGALLPGVNVMIKGTTVGTTTDSKGAYTIDAIN